MTPTDCKYTRTHEWVRIEGDSAVMGITDHAQDALGDITFVELPAVGAEVKKEKECGVIESVKAASDLYSPLSGKVTEVNDSLQNAPEVINSDPYGKGWLFRIDGISAGETGVLMDAKAYDEFLESEK